VPIAQSLDHFVVPVDDIVAAEKGGSRWQELGQPTALIGR
jgi:hypothetical protein